MTRHTPNDLARQIHIDSTTTVTTIDAAIRHLQDTIAGYPTSTPGAAPPSSQRWLDTDHRDPDPGPDTTVERNAWQNDIAARDQKRITQLARQTSELIAELAGLCTRWGIRGVDATTVGNKLSSVLDDLWCANCRGFGASNPRRTGHTECAFCENFRKEYKVPASREIIDIHSRRRLSSADVDRDMTKRYGPDWRKKLGKKRSVAVQ